MAATPPNNSGGAGNGAKPADRSASGTLPRANPAQASVLETGGTVSPRMVKCPKCATDVREIARFCPRCHMTLRYSCPSCGNEQRHGGTCEKCGVDFVKYLSAVVSGQKAQADALHDRIQSRSNFVVNLLLIPVTGGIHLFKYFFSGSRGDKR